MVSKTASCTFDYSFGHSQVVNDNTLGLLVSLASFGVSRWSRLSQAEGGPPAVNSCRKHGVTQLYPKHQPGTAAPAASQIPFRQIRAHQDAQTITVYQAYSRAIADPAVAAQKLHASDKFRHTRMTWIKPSWAWMLYRAGYSYKDAGQERILALKMRKEDFIKVLEKGVLTSHGSSAQDGEQDTEQAAEEEDINEREQGEKAEAAASETGRKRRRHRDPAKPKSPDVKIQWDPERTVRLEKLEYRSIQIGIPAAISPQWTEEWIVSIEDVTARARELKRVLDEEPEVTDAALREKGLIPHETPFELPEELQKSLGMIDNA